MGLALVVGPAKAGKVARLLEGYLEAIDRDPVLIVPNRSDVERIERDLLARSGALLAGSIGTFDDVFRELAEGAEDARPVLSDAQRGLAARRVLGRTPLNGLGRSARFAGFADSLLAVLAELESGLLDPEQLDGDLALLYGSYRVELDRLGLWDRDLLRRRAVERLRTDLDAWDGRPVFAYGFEDLTGAEWGLLEALAARTELTVSMPYEPGRPVFSSLRRTQEDLAALAAGRIDELPARAAEYGHAALAHLERYLFSDAAPEGPRLDGAVRFLEGAGARGSLELVAESIRELAADGTPLEQIALVVPAVERWRAPLETVLGTLGIPFAIEGRVRLGQTPYGQALLALLRFEWQQGGRRDLYAFLRSPYSGFGRSNVDFLEGRLRGRGVSARESVEEETIRLRDGQPLPPLETIRGASGPLDAVRALATSMLRHAHGLDAPPVGEASRADLRGYDALTRLLDELDGWTSLGGDLALDEILACARARRGAARLRRRARPRVGARPRPRPHAPLRRRLPARPRGGDAAASRCGLAVPRRRRARRARPALGGAADAARPGRARALPLLHRLHAGGAAPDARPRGRDRRGQPARAEPVLGRGRRTLRRRRGAARHAEAAAVTADLGARVGADRARAAACAGTARRARAGRRRGDRDRERLGAPPAQGAWSLRAGDDAAPPARAGGAGREDPVQRHRARAFRGLLLGVVLRAADLAAPDRPEGRRDAARLGRAHDPAPLLRRPAAERSAATASSRSGSTTHWRSSASASRVRSRA